MHVTLQKENSTSGMCWNSLKKPLSMWAHGHLQKIFYKISQSVRKNTCVWQNEIKGPSWFNNWLRVEIRCRNKSQFFSIVWGSVLIPVLFGMFLNDVEKGVRRGCSIFHTIISLFTCLAERSHAVGRLEVQYLVKPSAAEHETMHLQ